MVWPGKTTTLSCCRLLWWRERCRSVSGYNDQRPNKHTCVRIYVGYPTKIGRCNGCRHLDTITAVIFLHHYGTVLKDCHHSNNFESDLSAGTVCLALKTCLLWVWEFIEWEQGKNSWVLVVSPYHFTSMIHTFNRCICLWLVIIIGKRFVNNIAIYPCSMAINHYFFVPFVLSTTYIKNHYCVLVYNNLTMKQFSREKNDQ